MKILLVTEDWYGSLGHSFKNVLQKTGYEVKVFDYRKVFSENHIFRNYKYIRRLTSRFAVNKMNELLYKEASSYKPDLLLILKGELVYPEVLHKIKKELNTLLFNFNGDNPFNPVNSTKWLIESIPIYDCHFTWGKFLISELKEAGAKRVEYLPFGYDPELHYPVEVSEKEKEKYGSDIVFVGTWEREREQWLENLVDYDLGVWGNSWEYLKSNSPLRKCVKSKAVYGEPVSKIYNSSKIALNFIRKQNGNAHNMKTFEIPACGGFMLTMRTEEQCEFFKEGEEIACFESVEELREKIDYYLENEEERQRIAKNGHIKVLKGKNEIKNRVEFIISKYYDILEN